MNVYLEPFRTLDVELLLEHAAGVPVAELLAMVYQDHPHVRSDPLLGVRRAAIPTELFGQLHYTDDS
jgi:hypothetical protein